MTVNLDAAEEFLATNGRLLDRLRLRQLLHRDSVDRLLATVDGYRNQDHGYGWGLEPDLRSMGSQPGGALHALEVFIEVAPSVTPRTIELCEWLDTVSLADGGIPFALPIGDPGGCAPFWVGADSERSSLHMTAAVAALLLRVAESDRASPNTVGYHEQPGSASSSSGAGSRSRTRSSSSTSCGSSTPRPRAIPMHSASSSGSDR